MRLTTPKFRSSTAMPSDSDIRTEFVYSSLIVSHGAQGQGSMFGATRGAAIPLMGNAVAANLQAHHKNHDYHSTNLAENGRLGSSIGDVDVRAIALDVEQAVPQLVTGAEGTQSLYGATIQEFTEMAAKCYFILKVGAKEMNKAPLRCFPAIGGVFGGVGNTTNNSLVSTAQNGTGIRAGRQLRSVISIDRADTLEGLLGVASGATLAFRTTSAQCQETMVTCFMDCGVQGDVR